MNSPAKAVAAPASQEIQQIPIGNLLPSKDNPRKSIDAVFLAQLADSIQQLGVQVPLLVRKIWSRPEGPQHYEIVAGHRRYFAARNFLKLETLPCIVREMSDDEAREIMLVENLQREDLPPLEEAEAYEALRATLGTAEAVAAKVGKPIEYVTRRLKLLTLIPFSCTALAHRLIALDHALLLAKLAPAEQEQALRFTLKDTANRGEKTMDILDGCLKRREDPRFSRYWEPESVLSLKAFIEREIKLDLERAPWDLADAGLVPAAGACAGCAKNTAANTALFSDLAVTDARCTDSACFAEKRAAYVQQQLDAVKAAGKDAVRVSWKSTSSKPRSLDDSAKYLGQVFKHGQWLDAKKGSCAFVRTGVTVDFDERKFGSPDAKKKPGMQVLVCVEPDCKVHKKAWKQQPARSSNHGGYDAKAEEEKRKTAEFLAPIERGIREKIWRAILSKVDDADALRMVADENDDAPRVRKTLLEWFPALNGQSLTVMTIFWDQFRGSVGVNSYWLQEDRLKQDREDMWALAKRAGVDANAIAAKHFHDQGSIAPAADVLYPKGIPWPKSKAPSPATAKVPAKASTKATPARKPAKKAVKKAAKKAVRK